MKYLRQDYYSALAALNRELEKEKGSADRSMENDVTEAAWRSDDTDVKAGARLGTWLDF